MKETNQFNSSSFFEAIHFFAREYLMCCVYISDFDVTKYVFTKKLYSKLISSSQLLEDFLDYHGAKNNKDWYFFRELTAAVRHLSLGCYSLKHIANRISFYQLDNIEDFLNDEFATLDFLAQTLIGIAPVIIDEARRLNIPIPENSFDPSEFPEIVTTDLLEYNIDDQEKDLQKKNIIKIASEFLSVAKDFDRMEFFEPYTLEQIHTIVPERINEVKVRRYEMLVHNLQSSFDTNVIHGGYRYGNRKLKQLRNLFSLVFHLLQAMGRLLHFYERHLLNDGYKHIYKTVQEQLSSLINPDVLLDRTINFGLFYSCSFLSTGKELAREILNENIERSSITVKIPFKLGFHSRPSLLVAKIVQNYGGEVVMCVGSDKFDASSVLDIQWAGGKIQKENITEVVFEGDIRSLRDIELLASVNYGEDTMGKGIPLPKELQHLR
jgi:phosphotransferase system HPr-like phosphotransfer protein